VTRSTTTGPLRRAVSIVLAVGTSTIALGCMREAVDSGPLNACAPPGGRFEAASRDDIVGWASRLPYSLDTTLAYVYGFAASDSVRIEPVDSARAATGSPKGCVIARLTSARAFPGSGIGVGRNYIWVDSVPGGYRSVIIPENSSLSIALHPLDLHAHTLGGAPPASVGAVGYCDYCSKTVRVWCRSALDSAGATRLMEPGELEALRGGGGPRG
jgi:hypothetical protein